MRTKTRRHDPTLKRKWVLDERDMTLMREAQGRRDAAELATRCGYEPGGSWMAVWGNTGFAHVYLLWSKREKDHRMPLTMERGAAMTQVDQRWPRLMYVGENLSRRNDRAAGIESRLRTTPPFGRTPLRLQSSGLPSRPEL